MTDSRARLIALHLPQFHPIPENDEWWGKGFTEWTNTAKARPLFDGHYQPHVPSDLGFYDLRLPEARAAQAQMAQQYGVEAFCYYHYWFAGREVLERPVREIVQSGAPDFPFCVCWANESWTGIWHGAPKTVLIEQTYPGEDDHRRHFDSLLPAFSDSRYVRVDGRPLFVIHQPTQIANTQATIALWRKMASDNGLGGLFIVGSRTGKQWVSTDLGLDASMSYRMPPRDIWVSRRDVIGKWRMWQAKRKGIPTVYRYEDVYRDIWPANTTGGEDFPILVPSWDNSPRSGKNALVLRDASPELFRKHIQVVKTEMKARQNPHPLVFIKSWNEWAEGNHLEPDLKFQHGFLEVLRDEFAKV